MIQLYLLVLIIIFVVILVTIKEQFETSKADLQCAKDKNRVVTWDGYRIYLYGCNSLYNDDQNKPSQIGIKLFWNKNDIEGKPLIIVNTEDNDDTFIKDISSHQITLMENDNSNVPQPIKMYELKHNIIEGKTYFITVNYISADKTMHVSNTLKITATSPVPHYKSSGYNLQKQNLMNLLRDKTFEIYI